MNLREARRKGNLDQFIAEHENDPPGDMDYLDAAIKCPAKETAKADQAASKRAVNDG